MLRRSSKPARRKFAPSHDRSPQSIGLVLVGTYREKQLNWIKRHGIYNYPLSDEHLSSDSRIRIDLSSCGPHVKELWLYAGANTKRHCFDAEFVGLQTRAEFLAANPSYATAFPGKRRAERYLVFRTKALDYGPRLEDSPVIARVADFASGRSKKIAKAIETYHADGEFGPLANYLPSELSEVPRSRLRVCEAAIQLDFSSMLFHGRVIPCEVPPKIKEQHAKSPCKDFSAISLFSGAGGLDIGVIQAGFRVHACIELDHNACDTLRCAVERRKDDTLVYEGDIKAFTPEQILEDVGKKPGEIDLLFGGPPCQAFSLIGKQKALEDERGMLLFQMIRYARAMRPRIVMMEQVKGLLSAKDTTGKRGGVLEKLLNDFSDLGYVVKYKVCLAADYGAAQLRERVILIATRDRNGFEFPPPKYRNPKDSNLFSSLPPWKTVGEVLRGLPKPQSKIPGSTQYPDEFKNHVDVTPTRDRERIHYVPEGLYLASQADRLPKDLVVNLKPCDTTKYLRTSRQRPSNTLRCGEIFFHPTEDRYLTPREYMRIHGYPDDYLLKGPIRSRTGSVKNLDQHRQVANSVPPPLAFAMAEQVRDYLMQMKKDE